MTINREAEHTGDQLLFFLTDLYYMSRCKSVGILQVAMMNDIYDTPSLYQTEEDTEAVNIAD